MTEPALVVEDYSFWFKPEGGSPEGPPALSDVTFQLEQQSFTLVLGQSGAGKSTLALNLVGIYPDYFGGRNQGAIFIDHPERGLINRREVDRGERFRLVNMLFQNPEDQIVTLTVEEEIGFALENYLFAPEEIHQRIDRTLDLVGLDGFRQRSTIQLSGGEKQRVALAAMLALEPRVMILDEPTSNLDPAGTADVLATIDRVRSLVDLAVLVIEHEVDEVFDRVDAVLLVEDQRVQGPFAPRDFITERGLHVRDDMGLWIPQASEVGLELRRAGVGLNEIPLNGEELVKSLSALDGHFPLVTSDDEPAPQAGRDGDTVIEIDEVSFSYGENEVLSGVNLTARRGELLAVVGQNGSGKSTLATLLNGINEPSSGEVRVEGKKTTDYQFAHLVKRVAYIYQVPEKQFIRNTVFDEIAHGMRALGLDEADVERRTMEFLESVRLADRRDASPYVLSHGQKRRLSVACMVVGEPDVVVLDEPTFGQDYHQAQNLIQLLRRLADEGAAVVFITHDMRLVAEYADRVAVLCDGRITFDGTPADLFTSAAVLERARLKPPTVHDFSQKLVGKPLLTTPALSTRIKEVIDGQHRPVV